MIEDTELLRSYTENRSQAAFTALVQRHANLVYSVALRQVGGDVHLAQDVMQKVFVDLARKAPALSQRAVIAGWLYRGAKFAASDLVRVERRRRRREEEIEIMRDNHGGTLSNESVLDGARPVLDEIMAKLNDTDRDAVALRFFESRSFAEIGRALSLTEEAARKRVDRALEKMRSQLLRRGIPSSVAVLATTLSGQVAVTAPVEMVTTVTSGVFATGGAVAGGAALAFMSLTKLQIAATVGVVAATAGAISFYYQSWQSELSPSVPTPMVTGDERTTPPVPVAKTPSASGGAVRTTSLQGTVGPEKTATNSDATDAARRAAQDRRAIIRRYSALFTRLNLTDDQREKLIQILAEDREAAVDFAAASAASGVDASQDALSFNLSVHEMRDNLKGRIQTLLGDEVYAQFATGEETIRRDAVVQRTQKDLKDLNLRMNTAQAQKLRQVLDDLDMHFIDDDVLARAGTFLSPAQLDVLKMQAVRRTHGESKEKIQQAIKQNLR